MNQFGIKKTHSCFYKKICNCILEIANFWFFISNDVIIICLPNTHTFFWNIFFWNWKEIKFWRDILENTWKIFKTFKIGYFVQRWNNLFFIILLILILIILIKGIMFPEFKFEKGKLPAFKSYLEPLDKIRPRTQCSRPSDVECP